MERLIDGTDPVTEGMERIVKVWRIKALVESIVALERHRCLMNKRYGNDALREWDTVRYLNYIDDSMTIAELNERLRLSERRGLLTRLCTELEVAFAIDEAKKLA